MLRTGHLIALALAASVLAAHAQSGAAPTVTASRDTSDASRYHYTVVNPSAKGIVRIRIGEDRLNQLCQLYTAPLGWTKAGGVPATSATVPPGWQVRAVVGENTDIESWCVEFSTTANPIAPGQTQAGFSIRAQSPDADYTSAYVTIALSDGTLSSDRLR
jgi:hypothetical protein